MRSGRVRLASSRSGAGDCARWSDRVDVDVDVNDNGGAHVQGAVDDNVDDNVDVGSGICSAERRRGTASSRERSPSKTRGLGPRRASGDQRLLNWKRARAAFWPYFLRSFLRGSRVT